MDTTQLVPLLGRGFEGMGRGGALFGLFGFLASLVVFALLIVLVVRLLRKGQVGPIGYQSHGASSPEDVARTRLAERLANGEISPEEYLERSSALRPPTTPTDS